MNVLKAIRRLQKNLSGCSIEVTLCKFRCKHYMYCGKLLQIKHKTLHVSYYCPLIHNIKQVIKNCKIKIKSISEYTQSP